MRYFLIFLFLLQVGCGSAIPTVKPFKMDIQQGNVVTSKMLLQLRPGMTKSQVKFIMGSPLIVDSFHKDRWDYFYQLRQAGKIVEQRRVILDFDKDLLVKVRGDVVPQGTAGAATGNESSVAKTITVEPKPKQEKSWTEKLKFWKTDEPAKEVDKPSATQEKIDATVKTDASEANQQAPAGDAPAASTDAPASDVPTTEVPSVLAVPIGGVLAPDAPAADAPVVEAPAVDVPAVETPPVQAPVISAPATETPLAETPAVAPVMATPEIEASPVEIVKPEEEPQVDLPKAPAPMPAAKPGERLIFRIDRNLDLNNLEAPVEATPDAEVKGDAVVTKPKKIEVPLPPEEAPGYFERMLEKIGF